MGKGVRYRVKRTGPGRGQRLALRGNKVVEATPMRTNRRGKKGRKN